MSVYTERMYSLIDIITDLKKEIAQLKDEQVKQDESVSIPDNISLTFYDLLKMAGQIVYGYGGAQHDVCVPYFVCINYRNDLYLIDKNHQYYSFVSKDEFNEFKSNHNFNVYRYGGDHK